MGDRELVARWVLAVEPCEACGEGCVVSEMVKSFSQSEPEADMFRGVLQLLGRVLRPGGRSRCGVACRAGEVALPSEAESMVDHAP